VAIIIEDGSRVSGATSYITAAELAAHACARGLTLSRPPKVLIAESMDFLESFDKRFVGQRVARDQALSWPRTDVVLEGWSWSSAEIPRQVKNAQLALCIEADASQDLFNPPDAELPAIRKKVDGAVEIEYANPGQALKVNKTQKSRAHINILLNNNGMFLVRA